MHVETNYYRKNTNWQLATITIKFFLTIDHELHPRSCRTKTNV